MRVFRSACLLVLFAIGGPFPTSVPTDEHAVCGGEARTRGCGCPVTHEKLNWPSFQTRMKDFHAHPPITTEVEPQNSRRFCESFFSGELILSTLSTSNTFGTDFRIQAQLLSPFVCNSLQRGRLMFDSLSFSDVTAHHASVLKVAFDDGAVDEVRGQIRSQFCEAVLPYRLVEAPASAR